jgi:hypothetical protein
MPLSGTIGSYGDLFVRVDVVISAMDRSSFTAQAAELLTPIFKERVRAVECTEDAIQKDAFLHL